MTMKYRSALVLTGLAALLSLTAARAHAADEPQSFAFNAPLVSGFFDRKVELTGGGSFRLSDHFAHSGGSFRCLSDIEGAPAFFVGCQEGQGVRWDSDQLLASSPFKCTSSLTEPGKNAVTSARTVVLLADFYRQGNGDEASFTARMIVSADELSPDFPGANVWIQGIGCGTAIVNIR
jgi:hypothetical protein